MSTVIIDRIKREIEGLQTTSLPEEIGVVTSVGDGIAEIDGLPTAQMMEMVVFGWMDGMLNTEDNLWAVETQHPWVGIITEIGVYGTIKIAIC